MTKPLDCQGVSSCGAKGSRTPDLLPARQLLYQLSYGPEWLLRTAKFTVANAAGASLADRPGGSRAVVAPGIFG